MGQILLLVRWEYFRQVRKSSFLILYALATSAAVLAFSFGILQTLEVISFPLNVGYLGLASGALWAVSPVLAVVTVALVHAADLQGGYCRALSARGISRDIVLVAKALVTSLLMLGFHLAVLAMALLLTVVLSSSWEGVGKEIVSIGASFQNSLLYVAFAMALSHWRQSVSFTVGAGIALLFLEAIAYPVAGSVGDVLGWPVSKVASWTLWGISQGLQGDSTLLARGWFIPIGAAYTGALAGLSLLAFRRFDMRAGGD